MSELTNSPNEFDSPESYFFKNRDYIKHYYTEKADDQRLRLECLRIAQNITGVGVSPEKLMEFSNKFYNWIKNVRQED